jgi:hypothetical protein
LATLAGPVLFNYIPIWLGFFHIRRADPGSKPFGLTLVFATIPIMRIVFSALHANDEPWIVRHFCGTSTVAFWTMNVAIWSPVPWASRRWRRRSVPLDMAHRPSGELHGADSL